VSKRRRPRSDGFNTPFARVAAERSGGESPAAAPLEKRAPAPPSAATHEPDDAVTFERLMSGVTPLGAPGARRVGMTDHGVRPRLAAPASSAPAGLPDPDEQARQRLRALVEEGSRFEVLDDGRRLEGRRHGVDGRLVRRLRLGELPVDATLDLHGMGVNEARDAVERFVCDRRARGDRVLVIVHGRGRGSPRGQPVLRGEVAAWLGEGRASPNVAAFVTAPPEHGGEGAVCVLLLDACSGPGRI
jgi:DNA-nicking Smr family endonuclease